MQVEVDGEKSSKRPVDSEVPQGTVQGLSFNNAISMTCRYQLIQPSDFSLTTVFAI